MCHYDRIIQEAYEKKNELESFVYEFRRKMNDEYGKTIDSKLKGEFLQMLDQTENWLYGDGAKTSKSEYQKRLDELKNKTKSFEKTIFNEKHFQDYVTEFSKILENFEPIANGKV